ncbi:molybdenum cofactor biosynthesis protein B [Pseudoxanthomonas sp. 3HH-4]|uniref:molybdenum cofactor synthesis domain-containing protein n=1 Tax=Pseudoxanthomonas sp. 3HH-4 TaxID=1690214 RepID=UPI0011505D78|nr:molybdenum cofactor synthesis domain-containing protein [Pseudoxanthomonas sp. 3HH-4]TQM12300.1 molybdenum cofactor biosynthesis protein B [Pseudoxanthomonas sp. 3HH-4]
MPGIDSQLPFNALQVAVLTISDTRTRDTDSSGSLLAGRLADAGHRLMERALVRDDIQQIQDQVLTWADNAEIDVILTTGGTGFSPRDVTVEAVRPLLRKEMDGFSVLFHLASLATVGVSTLQSRAFAGQVGDTFIFCLPGSAGACRDGWDKVLVLELDSRYRPCSIAGHIPRLRELDV